MGVAREKEAGGSEEALAGVHGQETPAERRRRRKRGPGRTRGVDDQRRPVVNEAPAGRERRPVLPGRERVGRVAAWDASPP